MYGINIHLYPIKGAIPLMAIMVRVMRRNYSYTTGLALPQILMIQ